jgi:hypothetical protein
MDIRYRALQVIEVGGVRAYNVGDEVPAENVAVHGYVVGEQVEEVQPPAEDEPPVPDGGAQEPAPDPAPAAEAAATAKTKTARTPSGS